MLDFLFPIDIGRGGGVESRKFVIYKRDVSSRYFAGEYIQYEFEMLSTQM